MDNIMYTIEKQLPNLTKAQKRIAAELLNNTKQAIHYSTDELAARCDVSHAAISRFCYLFDFYGLKDLQISLAKDVSYLGDLKLVSPEAKEFSNNIPENVFAQLSIALKNTFEMIDADVVMEAAQALYKANKVYLYGIGASSIVAQDFLQKLLRVQVDAVFYEELDLMRLHLLQGTENDLFIAISYSGKKAEVIKVAQQAKKQGIPILAITKDAASPLAKLATFLLTVAGLETKFRSSALSSRIVQLYIVDVLFHTHAALLGPEKMEILQETYDILHKE